MVKGSKKSGSAGGKGKKRELVRQERRFVPVPAGSNLVVQVLGGLGAAALGAGVWSQFGHEWTDIPLAPYSFAPALMAGGAVAFGAAVWLGTSGEAVLRVGSGGVGIEKGKEVVRIPWYGMDRIVWEPGREVLEVHGKDETGKEHHLNIPAKVQPGAIAWIVKEGKARIPDSVDVPDEVRGVPDASSVTGELLTMDAVQVVGRRCAESNRILAYEPDARVCPRCERVYYKASVPEECACGASLKDLRGVDEASAPAAAPSADPLPT